MTVVSQVQNFRDIRLEGQGNQLIINQIVQISVVEIKLKPFVDASPYVGLARFEERHKDFFFGRDALIAELLELVAAKNLLLVTGASGSGKSSVVRSGLLPQLARRLPQARFRPLLFTPDRDPFVSLRAALVTAGLGQSQTAEVRSDASAPLAEVLTRLRPRNDLWMLFVDQFEEVFTLCSDSRTRARFLDALVALGSAASSEIKIVLALRADFFDRLGSYPELAQLAKAGLCMVNDMQPSALRAAIEQPAARHGVVFEAGLVEHIIGDVQGRPGALPLLQYTLDLLWNEDKPEDDRTLNTVNYHNLGGIEGALRRKADAIFEFSDKEHEQKRPASEKESMRRIFLRVVDLTSQGSDGRAVSKRAHRSEFEMEEEQRLIDELVDAKLLVSNAVVEKNTKEQAADAATIELAHEALLSAWPLLAQWIEQAREVLYVRHRLAADARRWKAVKAKEPASADDELWIGTRLGQAQELHAKGDFSTVLGGLSADESSFLIASLTVRDRRVAQEAEQRRQKQEALDAARDGLLIAVAQTFKEDPTIAATLLREVGRPDSRIWMQSALDMLQAGMANVVLRGHKGFVNSVAFSPEGKRIVTGSDDRTACIWNIDGSSVASVFKGHKDSVNSVAFSPNGKMIATGSEDWTARVWSVDGSDDPIVLSGHEHSVTSIAFSPDGRKIVTGSGDKTARIWNADGSGASIVLKGHESNIFAVAYSPDGKKIVTGSYDQTARIWNADGSDSPIVLKGHQLFVNSVAFSPDGKKVVTGSGHWACIWNADGSGAPILLKGHSSNVRSVAFSPDGKKIVTGSYDQTACIWNADGSGAPIVFKRHEDFVTSVAFSPDGRKIVTGSQDHTARIWNADGSGTPILLERHEDSVSAVAFNPSGDTLATSANKALRIWNADGSGVPMMLEGHVSTILAVAFSLDGSKIVTGSYDQTARIWNADGSGSPIVLRGHESDVRSVAFSPDGKKIVTGSRDKTVRIWNADGSGIPVVLKGHDAMVFSVTFSRDGKKLLTGSYDQTARIWNADGSGSPIVLKGHGSDILSVAFSPDGKKVVTGSYDQTARIWNADGSGVPVVLKGHQEFVSSVAISPDGKKIGTGSGDKTARIWNADGAGAPVILKGHQDSVLSVAFSRDGRKIVTGSKDKTALIWIIEPAALREALWDATSDCLSIDRRQELLLESPDDARREYDRTRKEIARRRGWPTPAAT